MLRGLPDSVICQDQATFSYLQTHLNTENSLALCGQTAAKRDVDIDFVLSDVKPVNTLFEQYGHMVGQVLVFHP